MSLERPPLCNSSASGNTLLPSSLQPPPPPQQQQQHQQQQTMTASVRGSPGVKLPLTPSKHQKHNIMSSATTAAASSTPIVSDAPPADEFVENAEVTAIYNYVGRVEDHELSFNYGDLMRIIRPVRRDPNWALAELRGKQGYIGHTYVKPKQVTMPWFHDNLTREQAEFLLKDLPCGSYLMRESTHYPGDYTLCLKSDTKVENYHILEISRRFTIDKETTFANLIELVDYYVAYDQLACKLSHPIKYARKRESSDYQTLLNRLWIDESQVKLGREIGIGEFGAVYKATYNGSDVAVKKIKDRTTVDEFIKEASVMSALSHPNLVKLVGVVRHQIVTPAAVDSAASAAAATTGNTATAVAAAATAADKFEISLVTEFMPKGSLLDYLTSRGRNVLTKNELIKFVINICDAMSYLEEKGIVHRDLAASNVLISKDEVAKVSDFGLAKKILDENKNSVRIRIKWTAPEAIKDKFYSSKSDMWSFGILLWEIFSYGRVPYPKIPVNEVLSLIEQGYQMEKPDGCPDEIYALMKDTWQKDCTLRPSFSSTLSRLQRIKSTIAESS